MALPRPADVSVDEKLAAFDSVPLFMKSLPDDYGNDPAISALQSLAHEGTPDGEFAFVEMRKILTNFLTEIAQNFKDQGNNYFKAKRYREALGFYTQGIDASPTDIVLQEALLCNRAACNLELSEAVPYTTLTRCTDLFWRTTIRKLPFRS